MRLAAVLALAALTLAGSACVSSSCGQSNVWGVQIAVYDQSGNSQADSALAVLSDGTYRDTMRVNGLDQNGVPLVLAGARDRAGLYNLCLKKAGFADYMQNNIVVAATSCGISPQLFQVTLQPLAQNSPVCTA